MTTTTSGWIRRPARKDAADEKRPTPARAQSLQFRTGIATPSGPSTPARAESAARDRQRLSDKKATPDITLPSTPTPPPSSPASSQYTRTTPRKRPRTTPEASPYPWHDFDEQAYRQLARMSPSTSSSARIRRGPDGFGKVEEVWRDALPAVQTQTTLKDHGFSVPVPRQGTPGDAWLRSLSPPPRGK